MFGKSSSELAWDLVLMGAWALYASRVLKRLMSGGGVVELGQVTAVTVFAALFLLRRPARRTGTARAPALRSITSCSSTAPCSASTPIVGSATPTPSTRACSSVLR